jgi:chromosome segregation ATPase
MAESTNYTEEFKTTLMGGYDKEDVISKVKAIREAAYAERSKLTRELEERDRLLERKDAQIAAKNKEIEQLRQDIQEKYQSYIDNYNTIGQLVYESRVKSEMTINEAKAERARILAEANAKAQDSIDRAQMEVERKLAAGRRRYNVLQEEISELIQLVNQVQHKFMQSFKAIHEISGAVREEEGTEYEYDENFEDTSELPYLPETAGETKSVRTPQTVSNPKMEAPKKPVSARPLKEPGSPRPMKEQNIMDLEMWSDHER